jgi:hypothetical protein
MAYIGKSPTGTGVRQRYYFTATGGETSLSGTDDNGLTLVFSDGNYVDVSLNGIALVAGTDYNTSTANTIGGLSALSASDIVEVVVYDIFTVADTVSAANGGTFSGNVTVNGTMTATSFSGDGSSLTGISAGAILGEYLVAGGGGGAGGTGGLNGGGGGGAGSVITGTIPLNSGTSYTVTVGAGGAGGSSASGSSGSDSVFGAVIAYGGGYGGGLNNLGGNGGCGGGSCTNSASNSRGGNSSAYGTVGGYANMSSTFQGGSGGGGANEAGADRNNTAGGTGGDGYRSLITGTSTYYGGGGGGGVDTRYGGGLNGAGGLGGGGAAIHSTTGTAGTANTGGGGGAGNTNGGAGGSGVVILRILTSQYSGTTTGSPTVTTDGDFTVIKYTASGSYTA